MKRLITLIVLIACTVLAKAQQDSAAAQTQQEEVFSIVEKMPEFPGGKTALYKFISENLKYPEQDRKDGKEGKVYISFIVEKDGSRSEVHPIGNVEKMATKAMVDEAMRVINLLPEFKPGTQRGKPVRVKYTIPISFKLG